MGKHTEPSKQNTNAVFEGLMSSNHVLIIRLVIAVVVLIAALILRDSIVLRTVLLVVSAVSAGFDLSLIHI